MKTAGYVDWNRSSQYWNNILLSKVYFVCVEVLWPSQPIRVMLSVVSLPNHTFSWAGLVL